MAEFISKYAEHVIVMEASTKDKKGKAIEFKNGRYSTTDKKEIEFLRKHREFGLSITEIPEQNPADKE